MAANSLVAASVDMSTPFSGTFLLEDGEALVQAIQSGDWVSGGLAAFSAIADTVAAVMDPLGSLIAAGLGWIMEHLEPLKGWLNDLTGDAGEVAGFAATWANIGASLAASGDNLVSVLGDLDASEGDAIDAYRRFQQETAEHLRAAGGWAEAIGVGMNIAATIVKIVHDLTRDAIAQIVGSVISYAATLVITLGTATPLIISQATSRVSSLSARIGKTVTRLLESAKQLTKLIDQLATLFKRFDAAAGRMLPGTKTPAIPSSKTPTIPGPFSPRAPDAPPGRRYPAANPPHVNDSLSRSAVSDADLTKYLENIDPDYARDFAIDGTWPPGEQIPRRPEFLDSDGNIRWTEEVPQGGYVIVDGKPVKSDYVPQIDERIDRYGPADGLYTSPVPADGPAHPHSQRSLPFVEDPAHYHQYTVQRPFSEIPQAIDELPAGPVKDSIVASIEQYGLNTNVERGPIAPGFGSSGGIDQIHMPMPVKQLEQLGILKEVK
ncbi:glycohydrolase toxin TNT-related protein [Orlajensenia leifsoniae]|uniref:DUF4237 domain-containing protein n=1 Tax=Orlajensenia leifsoniae TaxID=2561933 RepID=A0A4Y9QWU1_9MICO|nr:glycohydrolase toxin TNT-related protein [Leifsonia flava]TFV96640.1 DUF4237 domain-containing protein [Leifsonia flava]